jgi:hypothetical protein
VGRPRTPRSRGSIAFLEDGTAVLFRLEWPISRAVDAERNTLFALCRPPVEWLAMGSRLVTSNPYDPGLLRWTVTPSPVWSGAPTWTSCRALRRRDRTGLADRASMNQGEEPTGAITFRVAVLVEQAHGFA